MTAGCSIEETTRWPCGGHPKPPQIAMLLASVPPLVKITADGWQPSSLATWPRARSTAARDRWPLRWALDGLETDPVSHGCIALIASTHKGTLAL